MGARLPDKWWLFGNLMRTWGEIIECRKNIRLIDFIARRNCRMLENIRQFDPNSKQKIVGYEPPIRHFSELPVDPFLKARFTGITDINSKDD